MSLYYSIFMYFIIAVILAIAMIVLSYVVSRPGVVAAEKITIYECGFNPFGDSRRKFEIRFFLVGILFIIFDLEIAFLLPWASLSLSLESYWIVMVFLAILTLGLVYEWNNGGLEWE